MPQRPSDSFGFPPSDETPDPYKELEKYPEPDIRQQNKIIAITMRADPRAQNYHETVGNTLSQNTVEITPQERDGFMQTLSREHSPEFVIAFLNNIDAPIHPIPESEKDINTEVVRAWKLIDGYTNKIQIQGIISVLSSREDIRPGDLIAFLRLYPNPVVLEERAKAFLSKVEADETAFNRMEYDSALNVLMHALYGKRFEYMAQMKYLIAAATNFEPNKHADYTVEVEEQIDLGDTLPGNKINNKAVEALADSFKGIIKRDRVPFYWVSGKQATVLSFDADPEIKGKDIDTILKNVVSKIRTNASREYSAAQIESMLLRMFDPNALISYEGTSSENAIAVKDVFIEFLKNVKRSNPAYFERL